MRLTIVYVLLLSAGGFAVEIPATITEHTITEIVLAPDEDVTFQAIDKPENQVSEVNTVMGLGITCQPGKYKALVVAIKDGKFDRTRRRTVYFECLRVAPGPGPEPPQPGPGPSPPTPPTPTPDVVPGPRPEGFAGQVFDQLLRVRRGKEAMKLAIAADVVIRRLDEQTKGTSERVYNSPDVVVSAFALELKNQGLGAEWHEAMTWLAGTCKANARTFPTVRAALDGIKLAARRVAGERQ